MEDRLSFIVPSLSKTVGLFFFGHGILRTHKSLLRGDVERGTMITGKLIDFYKTVHVHLPLEGVFFFFRFRRC
jgi:hypothetical protein